MGKTLTWEDAVRLVEQITASADSGNWHAHVTAVERGYAVAIRQHNTSTSYYIASFREFIAVCDRLTTLLPSLAKEASNTSNHDQPEAGPPVRS